MRNVVKSNAFVIFPNKIITIAATYLSRKSYVNYGAFLWESCTRFSSLYS